MEFQSKLSAEQIKSRLEERTGPLPQFKPPWDQILCRQKRQRFTLYLCSDFAQYASFSGKLREQERGCLIKGSFDLNPLLQLILLIAISFGVQGASHLLFSSEMDYAQLFVLPPILIVFDLFRRYVSREQQQTLLNFIQNNLLE